VPEKLFRYWEIGAYPGIKKGLTISRANYEEGWVAARRILGKKFMSCEEVSL